MKVFLSWSGQKSRLVAEALREWLQYINSEIKPWTSGTDIEPGARWSNVVAEELDATSFGIVCVTRENQSAPWLNFEARALAKRLADKTRVVPLLIDLTPSDVHQPLAQFQMKEMTKPGILSVVRLLDGLCDNHVPDVAKAFERNWPDLEPKLAAASTSAETAPVREPRDLLEEILTIVRGLQAETDVPLVLSEEDVDRLILRGDARRTWITEEDVLMAQAALLRFAETEMTDLLPEDARLFATRAMTADGERVLVVQTKQELPPEVSAAVTRMARRAKAKVRFVVR